FLTQTTERVSVDSAQNQVPLGTNIAGSPAISGDGRFVAFVSADPGFTPGDTNGTVDVFVRDRLERTTRRVSVATNGTQANAFSAVPMLSTDGGPSGFTSERTNLSSMKNTAANFDVYIPEEPTISTRPVLSAIIPSTSQLWPPNNTLM